MTIMVIRAALLLAPLLFLAGCGPDPGLTAASSPISAPSSTSTAATTTAPPTEPTEPTESPTAEATAGAIPAADAPRVQLYCDLDHPVHFVARRIVNRACSAHDYAVWRARRPSTTVPPAPPAASDRTSVVSTTAHRSTPTTPAEAPAAAAAEAPSDFEPQPDDPDTGHAAPAAPDVTSDNDGDGETSGSGTGGSADVPNLPNPGVSGGHYRCRDSRGRFTHC